MKVLFYQTKDEILSINLLFDIIRNNIHSSIDCSTYFFRYNGASSLDRIKDVVAVAFKPGNHINHVIGDFNYATFFMRGSKTILTIHDLYRLYAYRGSWLKTFIATWLWLRIPVYKSKVVTAVSQCTKDEILRFINCDPEKIRVIYNCISSDFKPAPQPFNKHKPVLLQMGTKGNKNLDRLIRAIAGINCKLDIVGKPGQTTLDLLKKYQIDYSWESRLSNAAVIQKYVKCDMLVFVSTYEGFGMPIIEANAVERPVVTGNISAMPEVAGDAACLVDPFDIASIRNGILRVIGDDAYREGLIEAGRVNKKRFDAKLIADQYAHLYEEVYKANS